MNGALANFSPHFIAAGSTSIKLRSHVVSQLGNSSALECLTLCKKVMC